MTLGHCNRKPREADGVHFAGAEICAAADGRLVSQAPYWAHLSAPAADILRMAKFTVAILDWVHSSQRNIGSASMR